MVLMSIIGWGAAALFWKTLSDVSEKQDMNACPNLNKKDFDLKNMARGVDPKDVYRIAARCRVRLEDDVLPYYKYNDCLSYVRKHANSPSDVDEFILNWKKEARRTEEAKAKSIQRANRPDYEAVVNVFKERKTGRGTIILTFSHWWNLTEDEHNERVHKLYTQTYLGECAVRPPVVRFDPSIYGKRTEVWEMEANEGDIQGDRQTMYRWARLYSACSRECGFEPKL